MSDDATSYNNLMQHFSEQEHSSFSSDGGKMYLSDAQEKVLAILPIPSAILSIIGSSIIIYMAKTRNKRNWTPYTRLLLGLSISDIIFSITISFSSFLKPKETSHRVWAFGNDASCSAVGFLIQLTNSAGFYNACLSVYFLLTARFGLKNGYIARCIEPTMHFIAIGYPLITATVGSVLGVYAEPAVGLACWVNDYPRNCGDGPDNTGEECLSSTIGWFYFGLPFFLILLILVTNNIVIWRFVRKQTIPFRQTAKQEGVLSLEQSREEDSVFSEPDATIYPSYRSEEFTVKPSSDFIQGQSLPPTLQSEYQGDSESYRDEEAIHQEKESSRQIQHRRDQLRRLKLVSSQTFLFVVSFVICSMWAGLMALFESSTESNEDELSMMVKIYPILVLNSFFAPLQGFFNLLVYIRPKYLKWRHEFPKETKLWAVKRSIFGDGVKPRKQGTPPPNTQGTQRATPVGTERNAKVDQIELENNGKVDEPATKPIPRDFVSSLTASLGDFDHVYDEGREDGRWGEDAVSHGKHSTRSSAKRASRFQSSLDSWKASSLEMISETAESVFDPPNSLSGSLFELESPTTESSDEPESATTSKEHASNTDRLSICMSPAESEKRWSSNSRSLPLVVTPEQNPKIAFSPGLDMPKRVASSAEWDGDIASIDSSTDAQIRVPARRRSLSPELVTSLHTASYHSDVSESSFDLSLDLDIDHSSDSDNSFSESSDFSSDYPIKVPTRRTGPPPAEPIGIGPPPLTAEDQ